MSENEFEDASPAPMSSNLPLPGQLVRQTREQHGLSLQDLSEATRLTENVLNAVERDDFHAMGEPVYARGYYRKCAEALGLNSERLVEAYEQHSGTGSPVPTIEQRPSIAYREGPGRTALGIAVGLMLAVFLGCGLWLWSEDQTGSPGAQAAMPAMTTPQAVSVPAKAPVARSATPAPAPSAAPTAQLAQAPSATAVPVAAPQASAAPATASPSPVASASDMTALRVEIRGGEAWVDVRDRDGSKLLYKLLQDGHVREIQGLTPFRISLGRADHVRILLGDRALDLSPQIKPGLTANFLLDGGGRMYQPEIAAEEAG